MKFLALFALFVVAAASRRVPFDPQLDEHWENFKKAFGKSYNGQREEIARRFIFEQNVAKIVHHNLRADVGIHSFKRGLNEFADMSHEEFVKTFNGYKRPAYLKSNASTWVEPYYVELPENVDWREQGFVTPVKNQGHCGSCWAFSATGSLEGQHKKKTGNLVSLSEQQLVDCSTAEGNNGCGGGLMDNAFQYIKDQGGIDTEESYPYTAKDGRCHFNKATIGATCTGFTDIPSGDEDALMQAVAVAGPISVAIDASHESFQTYASGVYDEPACSSDNLDHGVLIVGYGTEDGRDYWLVKNSWGPSWGLKGYLKMSRNKENQCGIATQASFPHV